MSDQIEIYELWPGDHAPGEWKLIGTAETWEEAESMAQKAYDPKGFGGFRHPGGGPDYGTIEARFHGRRVRFYPPQGIFLQDEIRLD